MPTVESAQVADSNALDERPSPFRKARVRLVLIVVLLLALLGGALWLWQYETRGKYIESTNDAYVHADAVVVSSKVSGYVADLEVADNQPVTAGQVLLRIDPRDYKAQIDQYRADAGGALASANGTRAQIREQQATIEQSRAQLAAARSTLALAHSQVIRYAPLISTGAETDEKLDQLRNQERQATAQVASAQAALTNAERRVGTLETQIDQALSRGKATEAQLGAANANLDATTIRASIDGRVGNKSVQVGQFVQPGLRLMSIVPVNRLYIEANFKETQVGLMRVGQPATLKVDALPGVEFRGHVESFSPGTGAQFSLIPPQNATGNFTKIVQRVPVRIAIDAAPGARKLLLPGMSVTVNVDTVTAKDATDAVIREQDSLNRRLAK